MSDKEEHKSQGEAWPAAGPGRLAGGNSQGLTDWEQLRSHYVFVLTKSQQHLWYCRGDLLSYTLPLFCRAGQKQPETDTKAGSEWCWWLGVLPTSLKISMIRLKGPIIQTNNQGWKIQQWLMYKLHSLCFTLAVMLLEEIWWCADSGLFERKMFSHDLSSLSAGLALQPQTVNKMNI